MTLLDVRGLTVRASDGRTLVDDLSFTVVEAVNGSASSANPGPASP